MGRSIKITLGDTVVRNFSGDKMSDASVRARYFLDANPQLKSIDIGDDLDFWAVEYVLREIQQSSTDFKIPAGNTLKHAIRNYQVAKAIEVDIECYDDVIRVLNAFVEARSLPSYSALTELITRTDKEDPLFEKMAEKLANARYLGNISDEEYFEQYLEANENLKRAIEKVDEAKSAARRERDAAATRQREEQDARKREADALRKEEAPREEKEKNKREDSGFIRDFRQSQETRAGLCKKFDRPY